MVLLPKPKIYLGFISLVLFLLIQSLDSFSQAVTTDIQPPSANATSLGVFGEYPVSLSTGVPDIAIPIYKVKYHSIECDISLNYNTNLVKPDIHPGWVGLGWNLAAGGSITRVINGMADDDYIGYYRDHSDFARTDWASPTQIDYVASSEFFYMWRDGYHYIDAKPDEFDFSFLGISGTFFLDETGKWRVRSDKKIEVVDDGGGFEKFTLIDSQGIQYIFGGNHSAIESTQSMFYSSFMQRNNSTTWNLTKILLPNGKNIVFNYERGLTTLSPVLEMYDGYYTSFYFSGSAIRTSYLKSIETEKEAITFFRSPTVELQYDINDFSATVSKFSTPLNVDPQGWDKLDKIEVSDKLSNQIMKTVKFTYNNDPLKRLKLLKVSEFGGSDLSISNDYNILYNDNISLPSKYFAKQIDFFGFYNGTNTDYSSPSNFNTSLAINPTTLQAEVLSQITYPTKGYTKYTFEANTYSKEVATNRYDPLVVSTTDNLGSGLRIKKIENFDSNGQLLKFNQYSYQNNYSSIGNNGLSSGILANKSKIWYYINPYGASNFFARLYNPTPGNENNNGGSILYSLVTEIRSDGSYTKNVFSNFDTGVSNEYMDLPPYYSLGNPREGLGFTSKAFERGKPLKEEVFDNADHLLNVHTENYIRINEATEYVRGYELEWYNSGQEDSKAVKTLTYPYLLSGEQTMRYQTPGSVPLTSSTNYVYDVNTLNPLSITKDNNDGTILIKKIRYVGDIFGTTSPASNPDPLLNPYSYMLKNNMVGIPIETIEYLSKNGVDKVIGSSLIKFKGLVNYTGSYPTVTTIKDIVPDVQLKLNLSIPKTSYTNYTIYTDSFGEHDFSIEPQLQSAVNYQLWDQNSNLLQSNKDGAAPTSLLWAYNSIYPVFKCQNASNSEIYYEGFEKATVSVSFGGNFDPHYFYGPYAVNWIPPNNKGYIITYWFKLNGKWTRHAPEPYTPGYDLQQHIPSGAENKFDDIIIYPADALTTTFVYDTLNGISSTIDSKGVMTNYEYDSFHRLNNIKDGDGNIIKHFDYHYIGQ